MSVVRSGLEWAWAEWYHAETRHATSQKQGLKIICRLLLTLYKYGIMLVIVASKKQTKKIRGIDYTSPNITVAIRLPLDLHKIVAMEAEARSMDRSALVKLAIQRYLRVPKRQAA